MAEELRKKRENVAEYLTKMVDYTKQGEVDKADSNYQNAMSHLDYNSKKKLHKLEDSVGYKSDTAPVAKGASEVIKSYANYINREIKELKKEQKEAEAAEKKFAKVRKKLEK